MILIKIILFTFGAVIGFLLALQVISAGFMARGEAFGEKARKGFETYQIVLQGNLCPEASGVHEHLQCVDGVDHVQPVVRSIQ